MTNSELQQTIAEIWALFRENREQLVENRRQLELLREQSQETERLLREKSLKTDRQFQETERLLREESLKTDRQFQETNQQIQATDKKFDKLQGMFGNQWGRLVESLIKPDVVRLFQERGIKIIGVNPRMERHRNGETIEFDLVLLNTEELVVIEVKSQVTQADAADFLEDLASLPRFFPEYQGYRVYGAIAGLDVPRNVSRWAYRQGLFVLTVTGEGLVEIKNDAAFKPKNFSPDSPSA